MHLAISGLLHLIDLLDRPGPGGRRRDDRGDVPGWVMVTLMTAIVVAALTPFVRGELEGLLRRAFSMING